jgi:hypothetical protein
MSTDAYELRGHNFVSRSTTMAMQHLFTFSVSFRLPPPSRRYWVAFYYWLEGVGAGGKTNLALHSGAQTVIARGTNLVPMILDVPGGMTPKDVLDYESKGALDYFRRKNDKIVLIKLTTRGPKSQTLRFNMLEQTAAPEDEHLVMEGHVALWLQPGDRQETLQNQGGQPAPGDLWRATL